MDLRRRAPQLGIATCLAVLATLAAPYAYLPAEAHVALAAYYDSGFFGALVVGLFALVAIVVFAAGLRERSDPITSAGAVLVVGLVMTVVALEWAIAVPAEGIPVGHGTWLDYHRWVAVALSAGVAMSGGLYARALGAL